ncbi:MAG TPA: 4a-hydroxytetrahydrobiopterin dehydratase [Candidatus Nanoarchaeia archaeon]|nr:4a-hydroxytetrahydrobiopterin dehydratase [Candidatus Nanoarchaeia archaeon]
MKLGDKKCIPCQGGTPRLTRREIKQLLSKLDKGWKARWKHHIEKEFTFKNFKQALDFTNKVGKIAEKEGHHPDIHLSWGKVKVVTYTHKINGLHENDFILAAKIDKIK